MRTWVTLSDSKGMVLHQYIHLLDMPDNLAGVLALKGRTKLTLEYDDGRKLEYGVIEYDCNWCGSYDHKDDDCPDLDPTDDDD